VARVKGLTILGRRQIGNTPAAFYPVEKNTDSARPPMCFLPLYDDDLDCPGGGDDAGNAEPQQHSTDKETGECAHPTHVCDVAGGTPANGGSDEAPLGGKRRKAEAAEAQKFSARGSASPAESVDALFLQ
jgi:hypothetical protein